MMFLYSAASGLSNYDSCQLVHFCVLRQTCVILFGDVIRANQCAVQPEMKGCQVRKWFGRT